MYCFTIKIIHVMLQSAKSKTFSRMMSSGLVQLDKSCFVTNIVDYSQVYLDVFGIFITPQLHAANDNVTIPGSI